MKSKFDVYNDPGHGWIKVPVALLIKLNIDQMISPFSYLSRDGQNAFLEEDCDATLFIKEMRRHGVEPSFKDHYADGYSRIRSYPGYSVQWVDAHREFLSR